MKTVIVLSISTLLVWFLITRFEPSNGSITLDAETIKEMNKELLIQRILWIIMMILQGILSYKLFKLIPVINGLYKNGIRLYFGIVLFLLLLSFVIFLTSVTSFWM